MGYGISQVFMVRNVVFFRWLDYLHGPFMGSIHQCAHVFIFVAFVRLYVSCVYVYFFVNIGAFSDSMQRIFVPIY
jgi:hypothetical protein